MIYHLEKEKVLLFSKYKRQYELLSIKKDKTDEEEANFRMIADSMCLAALKIANCCEEQEDHEKSDAIIHDFVIGK